MAVWFTADQHFGHHKLIEHCARPFRDAADMDHLLRRAWNAHVHPTDLVYHLGDFGFRSSRDYLERMLNGLNGRKILIVGNHDGNRTKSLSGWAEVDKYREIKLDGQRLILFHYPIRSWSRKVHGAWHLHGHSHGRAPEDKTQLGVLDVGVDTRAHYGPWSWTDVRIVLQTRAANA